MVESGGGDVEGEAVLAGQHRHRVGADLVGGVAVGGDAVGADDDAVDLPLAHQVAGHVVADQRDRDVRRCCSSQAVSRAPCSKGRVSSARTAHLLARLDRRADHPEGGAVAGGGQGPGVAVGEDARLRRESAARRVCPWPG